LSRPWKTIRKAANTLRAGDTAFIRAGTYNEVVAPANSGTSGSYIVFKAYPGERPVVTANDYATFHIAGNSYIEIHGLTITSSFVDGTGVKPDANAHHIRIVNNIIRDCGESGIGTGTGTDYLHIEGNRIFGNSRTSAYNGSGISLWTLGWHDRNPGPHHVVRRNFIYNNRNEAGPKTDGNGIIVDNSGSDNPPVRIEYNVVFNNGGACVNVTRSSNTTIYNNTCFRNSASPTVSNGEIFTGSSNRVIARNNILHATPGKPAIHIFNSQDLDFDFNLVYMGASDLSGPHDVPGDPKFVNAGTDPASADFHLTPGSPAIDQGTAIGQTADFDNLPVPVGVAPDLGAYEYRGTGSPLLRPFPPSNLVVSGFRK
jgi:parallel beta-helix repeat protein